MMPRESDSRLSIELCGRCQLGKEAFMEEKGAASNQASKRCGLGVAAPEPVAQSGAESVEDDKDKEQHNRNKKNQLKQIKV
jgi:hypothetical protein